MKTPITAGPANKVKTHKRDLEIQLSKAHASRRLLAGQHKRINDPPALVVWSFAAGALLGSRKKVTKVVERPTKMIKKGPSIMSLASGALSLLTLRYKLKNSLVKAGTDKSNENPNLESQNV